jgi:hypothetical protein
MQPYEPADYRVPASRRSNARGSEELRVRLAECREDRSVVYAGDVEHLVPGGVPARNANRRLRDSEGVRDHLAHSCVGLATLRWRRHTDREFTPPPADNLVTARLRRDMHRDGGHVALVDLLDVVIVFALAERVEARQAELARLNELDLGFDGRATKLAKRDALHEA